MSTETPLEILAEPLIRELSGEYLEGICKGLIYGKLWEILSAAAKKELLRRRDG